MRRLLLFVLVLLYICATKSFSEVNEMQKVQIVENYGKIPLAFTINEGQIDSQAKFTTTGSGASMFFTQSGTTFLLKKSSKEFIAEKQKYALENIGKNLFKTNPIEFLTKQIPESGHEYYGLKLRFMNANPNPEVAGEEQLAWNNNYFLGNDPDKWRTDVYNYGKIRLRNLYEGIDLVYYGNKNSIKYDFVIQPGADPGKILLSYDFGDISLYNGLSQTGNLLTINEKGELIVKTPFGDLIERKPYCYQMIDGKKIEVPVQYNILSKESNNFTFSIHSYDVNYPLIIDPEMVYSTYLGGVANDEGNGMAIDSEGNVYIVGTTGSSNFPTTSDAANTSNFANDAFVAKINPQGNGLLYATFIGWKNSVDYGIDIAVDIDGSAYIVGQTRNYTYYDNFTPSVFDFANENLGGNDVFLCKLSPGGNRLIFSRTFGGSGQDTPVAMALSSNNYIYIAGTTLSSDFPTSENPASRYKHPLGGQDIFVTKLTSEGTALESMYFGGNGYDDVTDIIMRDIFPVIVGSTDAKDLATNQFLPFNSYNGGSSDAFYAQLSYNFRGDQYAFYFGGSGTDFGTDLVIDNSNNRYLVGKTLSTDFPTTSGAYRKTLIDRSEIFVTRFNYNGTDAIYSTLLGGSESSVSAALDQKGNIYIAGSTRSSAFPTTLDALYGTINNGNDIFLSKLNAEGDVLLYSTFLGGNGDDMPKDVIVDKNGYVYMVGQTYSTDFPTENALYGVHGGGSSDAFVSKLSLPDNTPPTASFTVTPSSGTTATNFSFDATGSSDAQDTISALQVRWDWENDGTWDTGYSTTKTVTHQYTTAGTYTVKLEVKDSGGLTGNTTRNISVSSGGGSTNHFRVAYTHTGNNATVLIQTTSTITVNNNPFTLSTGDEIAIYTPLPDTICSGVGKWNGSNMAISVWGDNDQTSTIKEGFTSGQLYTFHLWDASESKEYRFLEPTFSSGQSTYSTNAMPIVSALNSITSVQLLISLPSGWNLISSNVIPQFPRMDSVFQDIVSKVVIVKNGTGKVYWPRYSINQIGGGNILEGYLVYMSASDTLKIRGQRANPSTPIPLPAGWSMIAYLPNASMSPVRACSTINDKVVIMKEVSGKVYWPRYSINQIGTMQAGKGYQIYLSSAGTLIYPASVSKEGNSLIAENRNRGQISPQHFGYLRGTGSNATILMRMNEKLFINGTAVEVGDEIGVFTPEGICAGAGVWNGDDVVITVWGDNGETMNIDGFTDGQAYTFRLWDKSATTEKDISVIAESGNLNYSENGITVISYEKSSAHPDNFVLRQNYPNPFNPSTRIEYQIKTQSEVTLAIYSTSGQLIRVLVKSSQNVGVYSVEWDGRNDSGIQVPSGIYLYRLQAGSVVETRKMVVMK